MCLSKLWEIVEGRGAWRATLPGVANGQYRQRMNNNNNNKNNCVNNCVNLFLRFSDYNEKKQSNRD